MLKFFLWIIKLLIWKKNKNKDGHENQNANCKTWNLK